MEGVVVIKGMYLSILKDILEVLIMGFRILFGQIGKTTLVPKVR